MVNKHNSLFLGLILTLTRSVQGHLTSAMLMLVMKRKKFTSDISALPQLIKL